MKKTCVVRIVYLFVICMICTSCQKKINYYDAEINKQEIIIASKELLMKLNDVNNSDDLVDMYLETERELFASIPSDEVTKFISEKGFIKEIYVDPCSYEMKCDDNGTTRYYRDVNGIIITDTGIFYVILDFKILIPKEEGVGKGEKYLTKIWIISSETEAYENQNPMEKYHFDGYTGYEGDIFEYADYYDDITANNEIILMSKILFWNEDSKKIDAKDVKNEVGNTRENFINKYGDYGATYNVRFPYMFYKTSQDDRYTVISMDNNEKIIDIYETGKFVNDNGVGMQRIE